MTLGEQARILLLTIVGGIAGIMFGVFKLKDQYAAAHVDLPFSATVPYGIGGLVIGVVVGTLFVIASRRKPTGAA